MPVLAAKPSPSIPKALSVIWLWLIYKNLKFFVWIKFCLIGSTYSSNSLLWTMLSFLTGTTCINWARGVPEMLLLSISSLVILLFLITWTSCSAPTFSISLFWSYNSYIVGHFWIKSQTKRHPWEVMPLSARFSEQSYCFYLFLRAEVTIATPSSWI